MPHIATHPALRIGITGGIGSGKTVVSRLLSTMDIPVYISDLEARRLMNTDSVIRQKLTALIGPNAYTPQGQLCKPQVASYLFASPEHAAQVNAIVHPRVREDFRQWTLRQPAPTRLYTSPRPVVGMESAILIEAGFRQEVDLLVVVTAPQETRIARAMQRDHAPRQAIVQRILAQMPEKERCQQADFIICNDGITPLIPQVISLLHGISL